MPATPKPLIAYCVQCKADREMIDGQEVAMPVHGGATRPAIKGTCAVCGTGVFKILPVSGPQA